MPKFRVRAKEVIYYEAVIEAESMDDAKLIASNGEELVETDSGCIEIESVELAGDAS